MSRDLSSSDCGVPDEGGPPPTRSPLHEPARQAGARFVVRHGWEVAASYSPVAAEIAACRASAGIADRSYIGKLELQGPPELLRAVVTDRTGATLTQGVAHDDGVAWWCPVSEDRALVLTTRAPVAELREGLERALGEQGGTVVDVTAGFAAIALAGRRARDVLAPVTAIDLRPEALSEGGFRQGSVAGVPGMVLCERGDRLLVLCGSADAEHLWLALSDAGRPLGATHVGVDALERLGAVPAGGLPGA
jgi:heterotetrameric sarcosine oxidase gamma subunit